MKKVIFLTVFAFFLSSSFTTQDNKAIGVSWKLEETYLVNDFIWFTCTGDILLFPEFTIGYDYHGVNNGNISVAQGTLTLVGTGYSIITGEIYHMDDKIKENMKEPIINGAAIFKYKWTGRINGEQGSADNAILKGHFIVNANGEVTSWKDTYNTQECR